ncbi:TIGR01777 family oxidoreductase [Nonomuraea sp. NPDC050663]|uniref:TIGR01777 family oxidoreductase n=1 Tax=Nonomuraea sp. NPDC050663 TaxID=3364370 RepID=UPI00378A3079
MAIVVAGASGLLGTALIGGLRAAGLQVTRLVRQAPASPDEARWDPESGHVGDDVLRGAEGVVCLSGTPINRRWSEDAKRDIVQSRLRSVGTLRQAIERLDDPPGVFVTASGVDFYGDTGELTIDESAPKGRGFLADLCEQWEAAGDTPAARNAQLRTGLVLTGKGGALKPMLPIFKMGLGAPLGDGKQWWSWITVDDWVQSTLHILKNPEISGPVNLTGVNPVTNREFSQILAKALKRPMMPIAVPKTALKLGLGDFGDEALLSSHRIIPKKLVDSGYTFAHTHLDQALAAVL